MLTRKQRETLLFIQRYIAENEIAPTEAEIAAGIKIKSRGVAHRYVSALAKAGYLEIVPERRRNIRLKNKMVLPLLGDIAAGSPIAAISSVEEMNISASLMGEDKFILRVKGDSMLGDNICDGDYVICQQSPTVSENKIAVVLVEQEEVTLKRLRHSNDQIELISSNEEYDVQTYSKEFIQIQGYYIGLLRLTH